MSSPFSMPLSAYAKSLETFVLPPTPPYFLDSVDKNVVDDTIQSALHVLEIERDALSNLHDLYLRDRAAQRSFNQAVNAIARSLSRGGRVIVSGMGKSGKIGQKFVATLNSLAIRSAFLHPTEALHGDLGMIGSVRDPLNLVLSRISLTFSLKNDTLVILSYSGKTSEILSMLAHVPSDLPLIAVTSYLDSSTCPLFAQRPSSYCILLPAPIPCSETEAFGFAAPTSSTTTALALTDALTLAVARRLHPDPQAVFHLYHPGGAIGASVTQRRPQLMGDIAIKVQDIPIISSRQSQKEATVLDAILTAARSASGWVRPSLETVLSPRQIQRIGREEEPSRPLHLFGAETVVEKGDWISVEAANSIQEAQDWILRMRQSERGKTFLKRGTILGIVDGQKCVSGVVEIEEIIDEEELKE